MKETRRDVLKVLAGMGIGSGITKFNFSNQKSEGRDIKPKFEVGPSLSKKVNIDPDSIVMTRNGVIRTKFEVSPKRGFDIDNDVRFDLGFEYVKESVDLSQVDSESQVETEVVENDAQLLKVNNENRHVTNTAAVRLNFNGMYDIKKLQYETNAQDAQALLSVYIVEKGTF